MSIKPQHVQRTGANCIWLKIPISQLPYDGKSVLSFGRFETEFRVVALPVYTDEADIGPDNASSVVALLRPV